MRRYVQSNVMRSSGLTRNHWCILQTVTENVFVMLLTATAGQHEMDSDDSEETGLSSKNTSAFEINPFDVGVVVKVEPGSSKGEHLMNFRFVVSLKERWSLDGAILFGKVVNLNSSTVSSVNDLSREANDPSEFLSATLESMYVE